MRKLAIIACVAAVFGGCIYCTRIPVVYSQVDQKKVVSTPEQEPTHLDPVPDKIAGPKAKMTAPAVASAKSYVVLDFAGTVSANEPDFDVVFSPEGSAS